MIYNIRYGTPIVDFNAVTANLKSMNLLPFTIVRHHTRCLSDILKIVTVGAMYTVVNNAIVENMLLMVPLFHFPHNVIVLYSVFQKTSRNEYH